MRLHQQAQGEACHFMKPAIERVADGTANPLARAAVRVHTASCAGCRERLNSLREKKAPRVEEA